MVRKMPPPPLVEDFLIYPKMVQIAGCLCSELEAAGISTCFCGVLPGGEAVLDFCGGEDGGCDAAGCGGQAWVRLTQAYPSTSFPDPDVVASNCNGGITFELEVGFSHCAPMPDSDGTPPTVGEQLEAVRIQMAGMAAMRRAISCCWGNRDDEPEFLLGAYTPQPVSGGCISATWSVLVAGA